MKKFMRSMTAAFFTATLGSTFDWVVPVADLPLRKPVRVRNTPERAGHSLGGLPRSASDPVR